MAQIPPALLPARAAPRAIPFSDMRHIMRRACTARAPRKSGGADMRRGILCARFTRRRHAAPLRAYSISVVHRADAPHEKRQRPQKRVDVDMRCHAPYEQVRRNGRRE